MTRQAIPISLFPSGTSMGTIGSSGFSARSESRSFFQPVDYGQVSAQGVALQAQSELSPYLMALEDGAKNSQWLQIAEALDRLAHLDVAHMLRPGVAIDKLQSLIKNTYAIMLPAQLRLRFYQTLNIYSFALFNTQQVVDEDIKAGWKNEINKLLQQIQAELTLAVDNSHNVNDNAPYLHAYIYHLNCAQAAARLISDTHEVDWIKHASNLASVAGSFFDLCESKGSELGQDIFEWVRNKFILATTENWYQKVCLIKMHQAKILLPTTTDSLKKLSVKEIRRILTEECSTTFSTSNWIVLYACIEALESALLQVKFNEEEFRYIIKGDPENSATKFLGLEKFHEHSSNNPLDTDRWCVRARITQLAMTFRSNKPSPYLTAWSIDFLSNLNKTVQGRKRVGDKPHKALLMLNYSLQTWEDYFNELKQHWIQPQSSLEVYFSNLSLQLEATLTRMDVLQRTVSAILADLESTRNQKKELLDRSLRYLKENCVRTKIGGYSRGYHQQQLMPDQQISPVEAVFVGLAMTTDKQKEQRRDLASGLSEPFEDFSVETTPIDPAVMFNTSQEKMVRILYAGRAGIGKSTLFKYYAYLWGTEQLGSHYRGVFRIPLRNLNKICYQPTRAYSWINIINRECYNDNLDPDSMRILQDEITKSGNQFLFLLDGFDELALTTENSLTFENNHLEPALRGLLAMPHLMITSRPEQSTKIETHFQRINQYVEIVGFASNDIKKYIEWFIGTVEKNNSQETQVKRAQKLLHYLQSQPMLWAISHIPLLLSFICKLYHHDEIIVDGKQQTTLSIIYNRLTGRIFEDYQQLNSMMQKTEMKKEREQLKKILEQFAFERMLDIENRVVFDNEHLKHTIEKIICEKNPKMQDGPKQTEVNIIFDKLIKCGFLHFINESNAYEFIHLTFQEYFAGSFIASVFKSDRSDFNDVKNFILLYRVDPRFREMWWFAAGILSQITSRSESNSTQNTAPLEKFFEVLMHQDIKMRFNSFFTEQKKFSELYEYRLLAACLVESGIPQLKFVQNLFLQSMRYDFDQGVPDAVKALKAMDDNDTITSVFHNLFGALRNNSPTVRIYAIISLEKLVAPTTQFSLYKELLKNLNDECDDSVVITIIETLTRLVAPAAVTDLCNNLLTVALKEDSSDKVKLTAANALRKLASVKIKGEFFNRLHQNISRSIYVSERKDLMNVLKKMTVSELHQSVCDIVLEALNSSNINIREFMLEALKKFHPDTPRIYAPLVAAFTAKCDNYNSSNYLEKTMAVRKLSGMLDALSAGVIQAAQILEYLKQELQKKKNPLFAASFFSAVKKTFSEGQDLVVELMRQAETSTRIDTSHSLNE